MEIKRSSRKTVAIEITRTGEVLIRAPYHMPLSDIEKIVKKKSDWINKRVKKLLENPPAPVQKLTAEQIKDLKNKAATVFPARVEYFAQKLKLTYGRITIRNQKTCWGSCSDKGNLSFNCLLMLAPCEVLDYVVVHELCHRREMNHSSRFWKEVEKILPDYKAREKWLRDNGRSLIEKIYS